MATCEHTTPTVSKRIYPPLLLPSRTTEDDAPLLIKAGDTLMRASDDLIVEHARRCIAAKYARGTVVTNPAQLHEFLRMQIGLRDHEVFAVLLLDNARRIIDYVELFHGTIDTTEVHVRSVLQCVVQSRADEIVLLHNHPRGSPKPSQADRAITDRLDRALKMIDVRILDHVIVGESMYSFVSHGLLRH